MWGETVKWCCKGDTDKTNLERCIQEDLVRWDLSQAIRDRQEKRVKEGNPGSSNKAAAGGGQRTVQEGEAAGLPTTFPAFFQGCQEAPVS